MALWTPAFTNTTLWLDASDSNTLTIVSGAVSEWRDKSGNDRHATQATSGARPTLKANQQNGLDAIGFTTAQEMALPNVPQTSGQHIFFIGDTSAISTSDRVFMNRSSPSAANLALYFGRIDRNYRPEAYWNNTATANWPTAINRKAIYRYHYKTGTPAFTLMQVDGQTPVTASVTASDLTSWNLINSVAAQQSAFDAYELIITPDIDSETVEIINGYLAWKWGLESLLPSGHPYKDAAPQSFSVSGIIRDADGNPAERVVRAYRRDTGALIASTTSDSVTGHYEFALGLNDEIQRIVLDDDAAPLYNDLIDRVIPA
jgi:hypothetical protein